MRHATRLLLALVLLGATVSAAAAPIAFNFTFAERGGTATATGTIVFESTLLQNPTTGMGQTFVLPNPAVLNLTVTVTGSAAGNGSFTLDDFSQVYWSTNGGTLDLTRQLVGQPTNGLAWGTEPSSGEAGDFNIFSFPPGDSQNRYGRAPAPVLGGGAPPSGVFYFLLGANGGTDEAMSIVGFQQAGASSVPTLREWSLALLAALLVPLAWLVSRRRRSAAR